MEYSQTFELVGVEGLYRFEGGDKEAQRKVAEEAVKDRIYKISCWTSYRGNAAMVPGIEQICRGRYNVTSNLATTYEITELGVDKGRGVRKIKELVGAETLICAGDFMGDIPMLKVADISYAVGNALDEVKAVADRVTVHAKDGALAQIIDEL